MAGDGHCLLRSFAGIWKRTHCNEAVNICVYELKYILWTCERGISIAQFTFQISRWNINGNSTSRPINLNCVRFQRKFSHRKNRYWKFVWLNICYNLIWKHHDATTDFAVTDLIKTSDSGCNSRPWISWIYFGSSLWRKKPPAMVMCDVLKHKIVKHMILRTWESLYLFAKRINAMHNFIRPAETAVYYYA